VEAIHNVEQKYRNATMKPSLLDAKRISSCERVKFLASVSIKYTMRDITPCGLAEDYGSGVGGRTFL
jgi:hypothetical protein